MRNAALIWLIFKSVELAQKVAKNAPDVWYLIYLTLQCLHLRTGQLDSETSLLPNYLFPILEFGYCELSKEALDTASVFLASLCSPGLTDASV